MQSRGDRDQLCLLSPSAMVVDWLIIGLIIFFIDDHKSAEFQQTYPLFRHAMKYNLPV